MTSSEIHTLQIQLRGLGFDPGPVDGIMGPKTRAAQSAYDAQQARGSTGYAPDYGSAQKIATLLPPVRPVAIELLRQLTAAGIEGKVISGLRTWDEQDALYAQGRTQPGDRVTNARGGHSNHNFGTAFDIGMFDGAKYLDEEAEHGRFSFVALDGLYRKAATIGKALGLSWGGDWKNPVDMPHYELRPPWALGLSEGEMLAQFRVRKVRGQDLWT